MASSSGPIQGCSRALQMCQTLSQPSEEPTAVVLPACPGILPCPSPAVLAQPVDHTTCNREVPGSTPGDGFPARPEAILIAQAQALIVEALVSSNLSKSELARRLGLHHSTVCDALQPEHNLTIKTMARILSVCGLDVRFVLFKPQD